MTQTENSQDLTGWQPYDLDYYAQEIVLKYRDKKNVLNESHKMRMAVAYGLERFWGEHLRLWTDRDSQKKSQYWKDVWDKLAEILSRGGMNLPNDEIHPKLSDKSRDPKKSNGKEETEKIKEMARKIWSMPLAEQRIALMVLTQFCDALVWWTQRYKQKEN